jgi:hypothetical protein
MRELLQIMSSLNREFCFSSYITSKITMSALSVWKYSYFHGLCNVYMWTGLFATGYLEKKVNAYVSQGNTQVCVFNYICVCYIHIKSIPLQALRGPEGSRRLRLPEFKIIDTWRWQGCQPCAPAAFTPKKYFWYSFLLEAESTPGPQCARKDYVNEKFQRHHRGYIHICI